MPHFKFNLFTGNEVISDHKGAEWPDLATARRAAVGDCRAFANNELKAGRPFPFLSAIEICDEDGRVLHIECTKNLIRTVQVHAPAE